MTVGSRLCVHEHHKYQAAFHTVGDRSEVLTRRPVSVPSGTN